MPFLILTGVWILMVVLYRIAFDKEYPVTYKEKYFMEPPEDMSPSQINALIYYGRVRKREMTADILQLLARGAVEAAVEGGTISFQKGAETALNAQDSYLAEKLLGGVLDFNMWCAKVAQYADEKSFYKKTRSSKSLGIVIGCIYFVLGILFAISTQGIFYLMITGLGIFSIKFALETKKRTKSGQAVYEKCMAFKRYCQDDAKKGKYNAYAYAFEIGKWEFDMDMLKYIEGYVDAL